MLENEALKDFMGNTLEVGDSVAYIDGYSGGSSVYLSEGTVVGFTPTMVKVKKDTVVGFTPTMAKVKKGASRYYANIKLTRITKI